MKKLIALFFVAVLAFTFAACQEAEPHYEYGYGVSYGLVHGHYVGKIEVVVDKDDKVVSAKIDEYFLPYNVGQVALTEEQIANLPTDVLAVVGSRGTSYYSKYVSVAGTLFMGTVSGESGSQSIVYSATGIANIEDWVKVEANAKAYVEAVEADQVFTANADGTRNALPYGSSNVKIGWTKSATGYWTNPASYPLGWGGNMKAIVDAIIGTTMDATEEDLVKDATWSIGDIVTGATLTDFTDYYLLAQQAYNNALATKVE